MWKNLSEEKLGHTFKELNCLKEIIRMCIELFIPIIKSLFAFMCFGSTSDSWINVWSDVKIEA